MATYAYIYIPMNEYDKEKYLYELKQLGVYETNIYIDETIKGKTIKENYQCLLSKLCEKDILYINSINCLGKNYIEIIEEWKLLIKVKKIDIIVLEFPLIDTTNRFKGTSGELISDLILQMFTYVAEVEKNHTKHRQAKGIQDAKQKGVRFGRPKKPLPDKFEKVYRLYQKGILSKRECAKMLDTNHVTFSQWIKNYDLNE